MLRCDTRTVILDDDDKMVTVLPQSHVEKLTAKAQRILDQVPDNQIELDRILEDAQAIDAWGHGEVNASLCQHRELLMIGHLVAQAACKLSIAVFNGFEDDEEHS